MAFEVETIVGLFTLFVSVVLVFILTCTLTIIFRGVRHTKVIIITVLLLMSNLALIFVPLLEYKFAKAVVDDNEKGEVTWTWIIQAVSFVINATFNVAHWILADVYRKT